MRVVGIFHYLILVSTVVRRISIVLICSNRLFIISFAYLWFADDFDLCVALAPLLWARRNCAWLLVEFVGQFLFVQEECIFHSKWWVCSFSSSFRFCIPCNVWDCFHLIRYIEHHQIFHYSDTDLPND
jgi:hypothetical protein